MTCQTVLKTFLRSLKSGYNQGKSLVSKVRMSYLSATGTEISLLPKPDEHLESIQNYTDSLVDVMQKSNMNEVKAQVFTSKNC